MDTFSKYPTNPEDFIEKTSVLINEQKATVIVEHLTYDAIADTHSLDIFTQDKRKVDLSKTGDILKPTFRTPAIRNQHISEHTVHQAD